METGAKKHAALLAPGPEGINLAALALARGEVVAIPTETVYGLAGDAFNEVALARIFAAKERPSFDPLIVHVATSSIQELAALELVDLSRLSSVAVQRIEDLVRSFWPGPLTLVLPKHNRVPDLATSGLDTVGIRMPRHPVARDLIQITGPLAAPSANRFGRISPTSASDVIEELGDRIGFILDGGACEIGLESTVVSVSMEGALTQLRPGGVSRERLEEATGCPVFVSQPTSSAGLKKPLSSPGLLESHYAPRTPLVLLPCRALAETRSTWEPILAKYRGKNAVFLSFSPLMIQAGLSETCVLSKTGSLEEAARALFSTLRSLDHKGFDVIIAEPPCDPQDTAQTTGLAYAILDRLTRASHSGGGEK